MILYNYLIKEIDFEYCSLTEIDGMEKFIEMVKLENFFAIGNDFRKEQIEYYSKKLANIDKFAFES